VPTYWFNKAIASRSQCLPGDGWTAARGGCSIASKLVQGKPSILLLLMPTSKKSPWTIVKMRDHVLQEGLLQVEVTADSSKWTYLCADDGIFLMPPRKMATWYSNDAELAHCLPQLLYFKRVYSAAYSSSHLLFPPLIFLVLDFVVASCCKSEFWCSEGSPSLFGHGRKELLLLSIYRKKLFLQMHVQLFLYFL